MKTLTVTLYRFSELSDEAKARAIEKYRESNDEIFWQSEIFDSLMGLFKTANIKVKDYSLGLNSYSYVKLDLDDNVKELSGPRAMAWLENNLISKIRITRSEYLKHRKAYLSYGSGYRIGQLKSCPFTGYCADDDYITHLLNSIRAGDCLGDALKSLADKYQEILQSEYDDQNSDEYISEHLEINEYEFTESGDRY